MTTNPFPAGTTYTVSVTPSFDGLTPVYDVLVYRSVPAGVCGPATDERRVHADLAEVDALLDDFGFRRTGEFGPVCSNGFADAPVVVLDLLAGECK